MAKPLNFRQVKTRAGNVFYYVNDKQHKLDDFMRKFQAAKKEGKITDTPDYSYDCGRTLVWKEKKDA